MSVIDELIVKLKLDLGRFRSDAQNAEAELNRVGDASRRTARNMESDGNFMASGFGKVRNQLLSILGLFTAGMGIKNFTQSTIKQADAFGFMSDSIGISTTRLRAYSDAAERAGGSGEAMTDALKKSAQDVANLKMGIKTLAEVDQGNLLTRWAGAAGLDPSKIFESGESLMQARLKVFETIRKTDKNNPLLHGVDPAVLAATVLEQGGIGAGVTNALKNKGGLEGFNASVSRQEKVNSVLEGSEELARKARESWFDLTKQFEIIGQKIVISLTPALIKLTEYLKGIKLPSPEVIGKTIDIWIKKFGDLWDKTQKTIDYISEKWTAFSEVVKKVTNNGIDLTDGFTVVAGVIGGLVAINVVGWITGIVGALGSLVLAAGSAATALAPLAAVAAAGAAGAYAGNKIYNSLGEESQSFLGKGVAKVAAFFGDKDAKEALETNETYTPTAEIKMQGGQKQMMLSVYEAFKNQGFSDKQAKALTAEVGRENAYNEKTVFGTHTDAANNATNIGFFSWQGNRAEKLKKRLAEKGLMKGGKMEHSQESLNEMAAFAKEEMASGNYSGLGDFMENKDVKADVAARQLGKGYIKWAYGQDKLRSGEAFDWRSHDARRAGYYNKLSGMLGSQITPEQKAAMPPPVIIKKGEKDIYGKVKNDEYGRTDKFGNREYIDKKELDAMFPDRDRIVKVRNDKFIPDINASDLYSSMPNTRQTSPRVNSNSINIGSQTFNIKANDTEGIKKELANKMIISEALTQNFNSGMR